MLVLIILWLALLALSAGLGWALAAGVHSVEGQGGAAYRLCAAAWIGLLAIAWWFFLVAQVAPLRGVWLVLGWTLVAVPAGYFLVFRIASARLRTVGVGIAAFMILALVVLAERSTWIGSLEDTGGYHWNIVQWLNELGVVTGLGRLQLRLAVSSPWLALTAALNAGPLFERVVTTANGAMLLLSSALLVLSAHGAIYGASRRSDWFLLAGMLLLLPVLFRWEMRLSPSPDVPLLLAPVVFGWLMLRQSEDASEQAADSMHARTAAPEFALLVFGALAASIKLSAAPLLAVGLLHYLRPRNAGLPRRLALGLGISSLILVPTVANSFRSTGCLLFPLPLSCADVAFGVGSEAAVSFKDIVRATAPWDIGGMLLLSAASLAALAPRRYALRSVDFWVIALAVAAIAFALATAPTSRFARGYLVLLPALAFSCYVGWAAQHLNRSAPARWLIAPAIALALLAPLYKELFRPEGQTLMEAVGSRARGNGAINAENGERWLWPNRLAYRGPVRVARSNDVTYAVSLEGTCWNQPIPCLSNPEAPLALPVRLRHPASGLAGGFVRP